MTIKSSYTIPTMIGCILVSGAAFARTTQQQPQVNFGLTEAYVQHKSQSGDFAKHAGYMTGVQARVNYGFAASSPFQLAMQVGLSQGKVDFQNAGNYSSKSKDTIFNAAAHIEQVAQRGQQVVPYVGIGYGYYNADSSQVVSAANAQDNLSSSGQNVRYSTYYTPIGLRTQQISTGAWHINAQAEYDYVISGAQKIKGSSEVDANKGFGTRVEFNFQRPANFGATKANISITPFYQYWNNRSDVANKYITRYSERGVAFAVRAL